MPRRDLSTRLPVLGLLLAAGAAGIYFAARAGGVGAGLLAGVALLSGGALALTSERASSSSWTLAQAFDAVLLALPGALIVYLSFNSGGYFPDSVAVATILLIVLLVARLTVVDAPTAGFSAPLAVAAGALGLFAVWVLASAAWSDAPTRALVEFDRAFFYLLLLVLCGVAPRTSSRLRWMAASITAGVVIVAIGALATRLAPDHFHITLPVLNENNLNYPLTYSNALGMLCVLGTILALYFATSVRLPRGVRVAASAAVPILATTVYLTLSRGPVAAAILGIVAFVLIGRPRGLLTGLVATVPTSIIAVASAYQHSALTVGARYTHAAASQGHRVAVVLVLCVAAAAGLRLLLTPVDARLADYSLPEGSRRTVVAGGWIALVVVLLAVAAAVHAPSRISDQYHRFVNSGQAAPTADVRQSVFSSANRGLVDNWSVALRAFKDSPLHGQGAGTYEVYWNQHRPKKQATYNVVDAHSLYLESLGEVGLVGFLLLVVLILSVLWSLLPVRRGANRTLYAALFAAALAWAAHAGIDWDWEMPAVTLIFIALGGAALAEHASTVRWHPFSDTARVLAGLMLLLSAITPGLVFASQRQLNDARDALQAGSCVRAIKRGSDAVNTLNTRSEAYEVLALCQQRRGRIGFAIAAMRKAVSNDPHNWRYHYELGVLLGGAGLQAAPEILTAYRLNPATPGLADLVKELPKGNGAIAWDLVLEGPSGASGRTP